MSHLITFIGFGEAAYSIASGLREESIDTLVAYDAMQNTMPQCTLIRKRADETGVILADSLEKAIDGAEYILSMNSASICVEVAKGIVPLLKKGQTLVDCNSASPTCMSEISELAFPDGTFFCDAAMMGGVPEGRHQTKMFLSGNGAQRFYEAMKPYNTKMIPLKAPAGGASAIKMFKSVWSKGVTQLIIESLLPAAEYGVFDEALAGIQNPFEGEVKEECRILVSRAVIHAIRRSREMADVADTIEAMGLDASMSRAAQHKLEAISGINAVPNPDLYDESLETLIDMISKEYKITDN